MHPLPLSKSQSIPSIYETHLSTDSSPAAIDRFGQSTRRGLACSVVPFRGLKRAPRVAGGRLFGRRIAAPIVIAAFERRLGRRNRWSRGDEDEGGVRCATSVGRGARGGVAPSPKGGRSPPRGPN